MNNDKTLKLNLDTVNFNRCAIDYDEMVIHIIYSFRTTIVTKRCPLHL